MQYSKEYFTNTLVHLDGNEYVDCHFDDVRMVYSGGDLPAFERCHFSRFQFHFRDAADRTVRLLQAMTDPGSGFSEVFRGVFPDYPKEA